MSKEQGRICFFWVVSSSTTMPTFPPMQDAHHSRCKTLKIGLSHTATIGESLTYGIGESLTPFEAPKGVLGT